MQSMDGCLLCIDGLKLRMDASCEGMTVQTVLNMYQNQYDMLQARVARECNDPVVKKARLEQLEACEDAIFRGFSR